jgi:hypothetical protein
VLLERRAEAVLEVDQHGVAEVELDALRSTST